jgi:hypothetical protein
MKKNTMKPKLKITQPLKAICFQCRKSFLIKFVIPRQAYSQKNDWNYWTGTNNHKKICDACLRNFYYDKQTYWATVKDLKKRQRMRIYIYHGVISG